tara:strand:+ start:250 stop:972 length:723 start_codon:yes stop_codon:yes gene_type:complete
MACPSCGMGCNYTCSSSTPDLGTCVEEASNVVVSNNDNYISKTRGVPSMGSQNYGPRGQRQTFKNFIDTDFIEDALMPESDTWSNHPGFIGGTWLGDIFTPKKNEAKRAKKEQGKVDAANPYSEDDSCDDLDESIEKLDSQISKLSVDTGMKERVQKRNIAAREKRRLDIKSMWNKKDCSQQLIDEQAKEFDAKVAKLFGEAQQRVDSRSAEDDNLKNVAIGVGVLVIGGVLVLALRRKK